MYKVLVYLWHGSSDVAMRGRCLSFCFSSDCVDEALKKIRAFDSSGNLISTPINIHRAVLHLLVDHEYFDFSDFCLENCDVLARNLYRYSLDDLRGSLSHGGHLSIVSISSTN